MSKNTLTIIIGLITITSLAAITGYILTRLGREGIKTEEKEVVCREEESPKSKLEPQTSQQPLTPKEVVQKFIEAELAGSRLGGKIGQEMTDIRDYVTKDFWLEPSRNNQVVVIDKYEIIEESPSIEAGKYYITVRFYCKYIGEWFVASYDKETMEPKIGFRTLPCEVNPDFKGKYKVEDRKFELLKLGNGSPRWKVNFPYFSIPYLSEKTYNKFIQTMK